jgi:phage tail sheath protein FI
LPTYTAPGVYVEEVPSSQKSLSAAATAIAAFVGFTEKYPTDNPDDPECLRPRLVTSWMEYERLYGSFAPGCMLPLSVYGYFQNGGTVAYISRVPHQAPSGKPATKALPAADRVLGEPVMVESQQPDADITIVVRSDEPETSGDAKGAKAADDSPSPFRLTVVAGGKEVETFPNLTLDTVEKVVNAAPPAEEGKPGGSKYVKVKLGTVDKKADFTKMIDVMKPGTFQLEKVAPTAVTPNGRKFTGSESTPSGINGLVIHEDVTMVCVPDLITAARKPDGTPDRNIWKAVQTSLIAHCEQQGNRMAVLDAPPGMSPQEVREWRNDDAMYSSPFAALYYPWFTVENPLGKNGDREILVPPSGHVAGVWARVDESRGVWKAPANETIRGLLTLERPITKTEQGLLNPSGINCIRPFGTRGVRIWGARTLAPPEGEWRYINVRRLFNMIETTILDGTQWAVFEPNDITLWEGVSRTLTGFLTGLWQAGALFGASADQAFYVKCDAETNPPESIDEGKLVVEVGISPVKPAEFVIFRISQQKQVAG